MNKHLQILIPLLFAVFTLYSQNNNDLVVQNYHSGYDVKLMDTDSSGEHLVSYGSDKELIFYNINKRVIYKRISIIGKTEIRKLLINSKNKTVITLQNKSYYPDSSFLVVYNLSDATASKTIHLNPIIDSLGVKLNDGNFMQLNTAGDVLYLAADVYNKTYTKSGYIVVALNLSTAKLTTVTATLSSSNQLNCFQLINDTIWLATSHNLFVFNNINAWTSKWSSENNFNEITASFKPDKKGNIWLLTGNFFYLLNATTESITQKFTLDEADNFKKRNHPFAITSTGNALYVSKRNSNTSKYISEKLLYQFGNEKVDELIPDISFGFVEDMLVNEARNIVFISSSDKVYCIDYIKKQQVFVLANSVSSLQNFSFIEPGVALAVSKYDNIPVRINFAHCNVKKEPLEKEVLRAEQIQILPNLNIKVVKDGCGINFFNVATGLFLYRIVPSTNTISEEPKSKAIQENCSFTGLNNFYITANEQYLIIPAYYPKLCRLQIYDIVKRQLLHELDLRPSKDDNRQIINHIAVHKQSSIIYVETFNNNFGGLQSFIIDVVSGKTILNKDYSNSFISYDYCGAFSNISSSVLLPQNIVYNLDTKTELPLNLAGEKPVFSSDDKYIFFIQNDYIYRYEFATKLVIKLGYHHYANQLMIDPKADLLFSISVDKQILVWNTIAANNLYRFSAIVPVEQEVQPSYIFIQPDGYFTGGGNYSSFVIKNENGYLLPYEEFDRLFNRPDKLLASTGLAKPELVQQLSQIVEKRINAFKNRDVVFEATIENAAKLPLLTYENDVELTLKHNGTVVNAYQIWVNGTALFSAEGKKVSNSTASSFKEKISITDKYNRVEVCFYNQQKKESTHDYVVINKIQNVQPALWVVTVGIADYKNQDYNLTYAAKDAKDLAAVLAKSTSFTKVNVRTILNNEVNKNVLEKIDSFLKPAKPQDVVLCFFAGHGVLDKKGNFYCSTYDIDLDQPELNGISVEQFEDVLNTCTARKKIFLIDACNSGLMDEVSAFTKKSNDTLNANVKQTGRGVSLKVKRKETTDIELMHSAFLNLNKGAGLTIIAAAAGTEFAYEDAKYKNGLFTYALLNALKTGKADLNKDKSITVSELKHFVEQQVVALSQGKQRPANRRFNNYADFELWHVNDREKGQLYAAASNNDTATIKKLIDAGYDIDEADEESGFTPLHYAARQNAVHSINWLIKNGASVNQFTKLGFRPISLAVYNNHTAATYLLICANAKTDTSFIYSVNDAPKTLVQIAEIKNNQHIIYLLNNQAFIQQHYQYLNTLFDMILSNDTNAEALDAALTKSNTAINFVVPDGTVAKTLMLIATLKGDTAKVKTLLKHGASINRVAFSDFAPLHLAVFVKNKTMVQFLLANGADKNEKSSQNKKPVEYVKDDDELRLLLE